MQAVKEEQAVQEAIELLKKLIEIPSISKQEDSTADLLFSFLEEKGVQPLRDKNNVWVKSRQFNPELPTLLLNSHHDTVKPNQGYTKDPFKAIVEGDKLFGLGSNDAGASLVSLLATFLHYYGRADLKYNLIFAASAEEEISGHDGIAYLLPQLGKIDLAIVGEPTGMNAAIAEKGLMVLDAEVTGQAGHAAREEGVNALYLALEDIQWFRSYEFEKHSATLGPVKMSVTVINSGSQHNVVTDKCTYVVDVRSTDVYSNEEILNIAQLHVQAKLTPRSTRLNSSGIPEDHPLVKAARSTGAKLYGSPTLSDQALMTGFPSLKMGPGLSARSHTADEFIRLSEIQHGILKYIQLLDQIL